TLQDGRSIVFTPDHRVLTTDGWVEAGRLTAAHRVVMGIEAPSDEIAADESTFCTRFGGIELSMVDGAARERTLAFFRLLGTVCSDGTYSESHDRGRTRQHVRLYFGTRIDAQRAVGDISLLTNLTPTISKARSVFSVTLPAGLVDAIANVPGMGEPGSRVESARTVPDIIVDPSTPVAILR